MTADPDTSTSESVQHYLRPEVKAVILKFSGAPEGGGFRPLLPNPGWYITEKDGKVRIRNPDDYNNTISKSRVVYITLDVLEDSVKDQLEDWDEKTKKPTHVIGTLAECLAYTLGADIDAIGDIVDDPLVKQAVEEMAKFLVQKFKDLGVGAFVNVLYSGGGIYVLLHHAVDTQDIAVCNHPA